MAKRYLIPCAILAILAGWLMAQPDTPRLVLPCKIVEIHDGDTLKVDVTVRMSVRLLDCWAPELRQKGGPESLASLKKLAHNRDGLITIPFGNDFGDSVSFGRVLGYIEIDGKDLSAAQVEAGHARKTKGGK